MQSKAPSRQPFKVTSLIVPGIFWLIGLGTIVFGGYIAFQNRLLLSEGQTTSGVVIDFHLGNNDNNNTVYTPIFQYTVAGQSYQMRGDGSTDPARFSVGDSVELIYLPSDPEVVRRNSVFDLYGSPALLFIFGGVFTLSGLVNLVLKIRNR
jgi:hypothetical protein